jgi:hypothetical protein
MEKFPNAKVTKAERTSETSVNFYETIRRNIPEECHLLTNSRFIELRIDFV